MNLRLPRTMILAVLILAVWQHASGAALETPASIIRGMDHYELRYRVTLPVLKAKGRLWLPVASSDAFQRVKLTNVSMLNKPRRIRDREFGNLVFVLNLQPGDTGKEIEIDYLVHRKEKARYRATEQDTSRYLKPERLVPVNETFRTIARDATQDKEDTTARGRALYEHVLERIRYDKAGTGWGRGDANYACEARAGNCTDFHAYFIALARSIDIPARFAIGLSIPADKNEGNITGYHCWAEFFANGDWIPVDISEAWKEPSLADYYFGHHPANRLQLSRGRDLVMNPAPAESPVNFLVYPLLEVDGKPVPTKNEFTFRRLPSDRPN